MRREKVLFSGVGELFSAVNLRQANETPHVCTYGIT